MLLHALVPRDRFMRRTQLAAAMAAIVLLAACSSDSTGVGSSAGSSLAFTTGSRTASAALASSVPIVSGNDKLDLTAITVVIDRAELKAATTDSCAVDSSGHGGSYSLGGSGSDGSHHDECGEIRVGPTIVDLPVDGSMVTIPGNTIPAGTYREIELRISTIRLQGTFNTKAFDVTVPLDARAEIALNPPITVAADTKVEITVNLPVNTWLVKADGSLIDPNQLRTDPMLQALVRMKIASSIQAFEDHDHDGQPDRRP